MSLFELPVSRGARLARVAAVLLLDLVLAGAGIAMILSYLDDRAEAARRIAPTAEVAETTAPAADVDALEPAPVDAEEVKREPSKPARVVASGRTKRAREPEPTGAGSAGGGRDRGTGGSGARAAGDEPAEPATGGGGAGDATDDIDMGPSAGGGDGGEADPATDSGDGAAGDDGTLGPAPDEPAPVDFSPARVRRVVDRHKIQLQKCYQRAAKSASLSKPLEGRVDVQFVIMPDGNASNVRAVANTTGSDQLAGCITGLIESWQFPSPGAEEIAFVWPFVFRAP